jgi:hypothetical protein
MSMEGPSVASEPFQVRVAPATSFLPKLAALQLVDLMNGLIAEGSDRSLAWDGKGILP